MNYMAEMINHQLVANNWLMEALEKGKKVTLRFDGAEFKGWSETISCPSNFPLEIDDDVFPNSPANKFLEEMGR